MIDSKCEDNYGCPFLDQFGASGCNNYSSRIDLLQKVIDGQATTDEQTLYESMINECTNCMCRKFCEQEIAIKNLLITKLDRKRVPLDLVEMIKLKINKSA
jgi:hypothetical protein